MKILCFLAFLSLSVSAALSCAGAAVLNSDGTQTDVQAKVNGSKAGDTVTIPAGTFTWTGNLRLTKAVTLQGAGSSKTTINNKISGGNMINATSGADGHIVISGINFVQLTTLGGGTGNYMAVCDRDDSTGYTCLIHDCNFNTNGNWTYMLSLHANGIIVWNCTFDAGIKSGDGLAGIQMSMPKYGNTTVAIGGKTFGWNTPPTMGKDDSTGLGNVYIEDCKFIGGSSSNCNVDDNARVVLRRCTIEDGLLLAHGQETSQYGFRHWEIYDNTFRNVNLDINLNEWIYIRGAVFLITRNTIPARAQKQAITMTCQMIQQANTGICQTAYPASRQVGYGWSASSSTGYGNPVLSRNGTGQIQDPCYIWDNSGEGASRIGVVDVSDNCGNGLKARDFIKAGRDYILGTPRPGWSPYTYPHPLRAAAGGGPSPTPTPTATPTPPTPTPSYEQWIERQNDWIRHNPPSPDQ
jgi:hypothetical protein